MTKHRKHHLPKLRNPDEWPEPIWLGATFFLLLALSLVLQPKDVGTFVTSILQTGRRGRRGTSKDAS
jgi:hypothetical protein